jgi:hypothetical protein
VSEEATIEPWGWWRFKTMSFVGTVALATASIAVTSLAIEKSWNGPHAPGIGGKSPVKVSASALAAEGTKNARTAASAATAPHERFLVTSSPCPMSLPLGEIPRGAKTQTAYDRVRTTASVLAPAQSPTVLSLKKPANPFPVK